MVNKENMDFSFDWDDLWEDGTKNIADNEPVPNNDRDFVDNDIAIAQFQSVVQSDFPQLKLLGYYAFPNQKMYHEAECPERAAKLAELLSLTFNDIESFEDVSAHFKKVYSRAVLIFRDSEFNLYGYFPKDNIARLTNVVYNKNNICFPERRMRRWFTPGEPFLLLEKENNER